MFVQRSSAIKVACAALVLAGAGALLFPAPGRAAQGIPGAVYAMTNDSAGNSIMVFKRAADGTLTAAGSYSTGGVGYGTGSDPLGSQGALVLSNDGHFLFAVNAGSNDVSVMQVGHAGLSLVSKMPSGGTEPVSVTQYKDLVYVLNAGGTAGTPNISGIVLDRMGV